MIKGIRARPPAAKAATVRSETRHDRRCSATVERPGETILVVDNVSVSFDGFAALNELSFVVMAGEMRAIIGRTGPARR